MSSRSDVIEFTVADHALRDTSGQNLPLRLEDERAIERIAAIVRHVDAPDKTKRHGFHSAASRVPEAGDAIRPTN